MSNRPYTSIIFRITLRASCRFETSPCIRHVSPPQSTMSSRSSSSAAELLKKLITTTAPRSESSLAIARPIPRDAPGHQSDSAFQRPAIWRSSVRSILRLPCPPPSSPNSSLSKIAAIPCPPPMHMVTSAYLPPILLQFVQRLHRDNGAGCSQRMTQRNAAAIGIGFLRGNSSSRRTASNCAAKASFSSITSICSVLSPVRWNSLLYRRNRPDAHHRRLHARPPRSPPAWPEVAAPALLPPSFPSAPQQQRHR